MPRLNRRPGSQQQDFVVHVPDAPVIHMADYNGPPGGWALHIRALTPRVTTQGPAASPGRGMRIPDATFIGKNWIFEAGVIIINWQERREDSWEGEFLQKHSP